MAKSLSIIYTTFFFGILKFLIKGARAGTEEQFVEIQLRSTFLEDRREEIGNFTIPLTMLNLLELNSKDIIQSEIDLEGKSAFITASGTRIPIQILQDNFIFVNFTLFYNQNANLTMKDIIGDPDLVPVETFPIKEKSPRLCLVKTITVYTYLIAFFKINGRGIANFINSDGEGLVLTAINSRTCKITIQRLIKTNKYGLYRHLTSVVKNILPGRIIILASQVEGAVHFHTSARQYLAAIGSTFVKHFKYGDSWIWVFIKDGVTLGEALVPNLGTPDNSGAPVTFEVKLSSKISIKNSHKAGCDSWPEEEQWTARRNFCEKVDGIKSLCDCDSPFRLKTRVDIKTNTSNNIPVLILSGGNRLQLLMRLLESLSVQSGLTKELMTLILDKRSEEVQQLAAILGLNVLLRKTSNQTHGPSRVSQTLRFGLFNALRLFPKAKSFIVLEDDLIVSPDFYSYMSQLSPLFEVDSSIYCVSALNFFSTPKTSHDPTLTYRTDSHPAYGWMMPRNVLEEFLPKWPHKQFLHDWDHIFASDLMRKGRHCVVPDVNRAYHNCIESFSTHYNPTWLTEREFLKKEINHQSNVQLQPIKRMMRSNYFNEVVNLISNATVVEVVNPYNISWPRTENDAFVIYVQMKNKTDYFSFQVLGDGLDTWIRSPKFGFYHYSWRLFHEGTPLIVIGVPISIFSRYLPQGSKVFAASFEDVIRIPKGEPQMVYNTHNSLSGNQNSSVRSKLQNHQVSIFGWEDEVARFKNYASKSYAKAIVSSSSVISERELHPSQIRDHHSFDYFNDLNEIFPD